jgi:hypothetical protein
LGAIPVEDVSEHVDRCRRQRRLGTHEAEGIAVVRFAREMWFLGSGPGQGDVEQLAGSSPLTTTRAVSVVMPWAACTVAE